MRRCYLVCYDIRDPKRLRQVFKTCKGYGEHWQYSIFFCVIKEIDRVRLQSELEDIMHHDEDQILILDLGENEATARDRTTILGQGQDDPLEGVVVL